MTKVITSRFHLKGRACDIDVYIEHRGYQALPKALKEFTPDQVIEEVKFGPSRSRRRGVSDRAEVELRPERIEAA